MRDFDGMWHTPPPALPLSSSIARRSAPSPLPPTLCPYTPHLFLPPPIPSSLLQLFNREAQRPDATEHWPEQAGEGGFGVRATTGNEMMSPTRQLTKSASAGGFRSTGEEGGGGRGGRGGFRSTGGWSRGVRGGSGARRGWSRELQNWRENGGGLRVYPIQYLPSPPPGKTMMRQQLQQHLRNQHTALRGYGDYLRRNLRLVLELAQVGREGAQPLPNHPNHHITTPTVAQPPLSHLTTPTATQPPHAGPSHLRRGRSLPHEREGARPTGLPVQTAATPPRWG